MGLAAFNRMRRLKVEQEKQRQKEAKSLKDLSIPELKDMAKSLGLTGYSKLKEAELIELIESAQVSEDNE